jgi:hypothetical protein
MLRSCDVLDATRSLDSSKFQPLFEFETEPETFGGAARDPSFSEFEPLEFDSW